MAKRKVSTTPPQPSSLFPIGERCYHHDFHSTFLDNNRSLTVALPPDYHHQRERCPVLYMHDGQNLFDPAEAAFGVAWHADGAAARLIHSDRIPPLILVGIANTPARMDEYTIYPDAREKAGGRGDLYARFVLEEVKPFIDANYRTKPDREHTAVVGSSLGGLVSLTMAQGVPGTIRAVRSSVAVAVVESRAHPGRDRGRRSCVDEKGCDFGWTWERRKGGCADTNRRRFCAPDD